MLYPLSYGGAPWLLRSNFRDGGRCRKAKPVGGGDHRPWEA